MNKKIEEIMYLSLATLLIAFFIYSIIATEGVAGARAMGVIGWLVVAMGVIYSFIINKRRKKK